MSCRFSPFYRHTVRLGALLIGLYIITACGMRSDTPTNSQISLSPTSPRVTTESIATMPSISTGSPDSSSATQETPSEEPSPTNVSSPISDTTVIQQAPSAAATPSVIHQPIILTSENSLEWRQLGFDPQRTGYVPIQLADTWTFKWIWNGAANGGDGRPAGDHLALPKGMQPIAGSGNLYIGHSDSIVRAIAENSGVQVWSTSVGGELLSTGAYDIATQSVYFGSTNRQIYRLNATNGQIVNQFSTDGPILMAPLLVGNTIFVGSNTGTFYALDTSTLQQRWAYKAGAKLLASPAFSVSHGGLVIFSSEDKFVHAVQAQTGTRRWRVPINGAEDPKRGNVSFPDTYPVVSEVNNVVIVRSYFDWDQTWTPTEGAPESIEAIRSFLTKNPSFQSFFVLDLNTGNQRFIAPVLAGAIGNGGDYYSSPPQAVVKTLSDGSQIAYLLWRTRQACLNNCDGREDTTIGEMDLQTGNIRFVQDHKNAGMMRLPTDEQSPFAMAGDDLFYAHWMLQGAIRITDRSVNLGNTYANPIRSKELAPITNSLAADTCANRNINQHYCPQAMLVPPSVNGGLESFQIDPGFYVYYNNRRIYDQFFTPPVRSTVISGDSIYWKTVDGAIIGLRAAR